MNDEDFIAAVAVNEFLVSAENEKVLTEFYEISRKTTMLSD